MAYWGEAMTYNQTLWRNEDVQAARQALARLGPTAGARRAKARTPREQGLFAAVEILFADGDADDRRRNTPTRWASSTRASATTRTSRRSTRSRCSARCRAA